MVSAFYVGVTALDVDDNPRARSNLTVATQLVPDEPAAWADLGLYYLREGTFDAAAQNLDRALSLAPNNSAIEVLYGLLESRRGNFDAAITHLQRGVDHDPTDARARYALATMLERRGGENADAQIAKQFEELLRLGPENLAILLDAARLSAKRGDAGAVRDLLKRLEALSADWPEAGQVQLKAVRDTAAGDNVRAAAVAILRLRNVLLPWPRFQRQMAAIETPNTKIGEPIKQFLKLPSPSPDPAAADEAVALAITPSVVGAAGWTATTAAWLKPDGPPTVFIANERDVRRADGQGAPIPFPSGPDGVPPRADGVLALDWRNNFVTGLVLAGAGGVRLMLPDAQGALHDVTTTAIADAAVRDGNYTGAWAADLDLDGDLDLVLAARNGPPVVLRNNNDGTFSVIRLFEGIAGFKQFIWTDLDGDGVADAALLDDRGKLTVLTNDRLVKFHAQPLPKEVGSVVSIAAADLTGRGRPDLVALLADGSVVRLFDDGSGSAAMKSTVVLPVGAAVKGTRLIIADMDNNGAADLIVTGEKESTVFLGAGQGPYAKMPQPIPGRVLSAIADATQPGGLRLLGVTAGGGEAMAISPRGARGYHFQIIRPRANPTALMELTGGKNKINTFGIGGEIELRAGPLYQSQPIAGGATHFGLGDHAVTDIIRIIWPNGNVQAEFDLKPDQAATADQRLKGSCPMLFTFDGTGMQFVTDLIWRSPLGLRINAQDTASTMQTEDWVKVRGDQLVPHDGYYDLRVTAELWETHFFDQIALLTVDHPQGTEVFVDERFARQSPPLKVYLTTPPKPFAHATDEHGNDVSDAVRERDGRYLDSFARGQYQGVAADHWVELDIAPDVMLDKPLALIGFGWIHPTDSSINVAMAQGKHSAPVGLSIEIPDGRGGWTVVRDGIGFPAGKNKTVVLPLDGILKPGSPGKLRLRTNLEVYWDSLGWATLLDTGAIKTQRLAAQQAELRYRGFSLIAAADVHSPELPRYDQRVGAAPRWIDLTGWYTRYGDVRELLEKTDDRYVIMNAGDEMRLRFSPPPPPPPGQVRDFVVIADGWEKDGDYNTAFSQTVLPLPRHDWPAYDTMPARLEDDPAYQRHPDDWLNYHTRYVTPDGFREALRPKEPHP